MGITKITFFFCPMSFRSNETNTALAATGWAIVMKMKLFFAMIGWTATLVATELPYASGSAGVEARERFARLLGGTLGGGV